MTTCSLQKRYLFFVLTQPRLRYYKSNLQLHPCVAGFHRESDFIHPRWISSVKDGFHCVILKNEYHVHMWGIFVCFFYT